MNVRPLSAAGVAVVVLAAMAPLAHAQSAQPYSAQGSILLTHSEATFGGGIGKVGFTGFGIEVQGRYTWVSPWSVGIGLQATAGSGNSGGTVNEVLVGGFVEPRYAFDIESERYAPYAAARIGYLKDTFSVPGGTKDLGSNVFSYGLGAGLLVRMSKNLNIDVGFAVTNNNASGDATLGSYSFIGYVLKAGVSYGFGTR